MIPRALRVLLPSRPTETVERQSGQVPYSCPLDSAADAPLVAVGQRAAGVDIPPAPAAEHERLAVSADLWRQLAARLGGMP